MERSGAWFHNQESLQQRNIEQVDLSSPRIGWVTSIMKYFKADADTFIKYDDVNASVFIVSKKALKERADKISDNAPKMPTDKELLDWARLNYPGIEGLSHEQEKLDRIKDEIKEIEKIGEVDEVKKKK